MTPASSGLSSRPSCPKFERHAHGDGGQRAGDQQPDDAAVLGHEGMNLLPVVDQDGQECAEVKDDVHLDIVGQRRPTGGLEAMPR